MKNKVLAVFVISIILISIFIGIFVFKNNKNNKNKNELVKVSEVTRSVFYAPQYVAIEKGFFKEKGIDIELITGGGADTVMTAVLSNQVDIGFAGPEASIYVYNEGKEDYTQVFAQMTKKDGSFLVSKEKNDDFKWEDLKGKTIIPGRKGGVPYMTFEYVLKNKGLDTKKDLKLDDSIKFDLMAGAFASGNAEYVTLFEPTASLTQKEKKGYIVASVGKEAGDIPYTAYFAKKSFIGKNEDLIQKFTDAIYKGEQWVKNHSYKEIAQVILPFFPGTEKEMIEDAVKNYKEIDAWNENPVMEKESFNRLQDVISSAGELDKKVPFDKIVNNKYSENVK